MFGSLPRRHAFPGELCVLPGPLPRVLVMPRATAQQTPPPELQEQTPGCPAAWITAYIGAALPPGLPALSPAEWRVAEEEGPDSAGFWGEDGAHPLPRRA